MQIVKEIIREIGLPIWICWGATGAFLALISIVAILNRDDTKHWSMVIPLQGTIIFL